MGKIEKAFEIAAPIAKETAKLTGKGLVLAGKGVKKAGEKAAQKKGEIDYEKFQDYLEPLKELYPDSCAFIAYEATQFNYHKLNKMGTDLKLLDIDHTMHFIFDEGENLRYKVDEFYDSFIRHSVLYDNVGRVGSVEAHKKLFTSQERESVRLRGRHLFDIDSKQPGGISMDVMKLVEFNREDYKVLFNNVVVMDVSRFKGKDVIVIADRNRLESCLLIYAAIRLRNHPKPISYSSGGGGDCGDGGE